MKNNLYKLLIVLLADIIVFLLVNPVGASSIVIFGGFVLLIINLYLLISLALGILTKYFGLLRQHQRQMTLILTIFTTFIIAMQSIGQLSLLDVLAMIPFASILYLYLSYYQEGRINKQKTGR